MSNTQDNTVVEQVDLDLDNILGMPGAESVMLPEEKKPNVFSAGKPDLSFMENPASADDSGENKDKNSADFADVLKDLDPEDASLGVQPSDDEPKKAPGRAKVAKDGTVELVKKLIDAGKIVPFDDDKPIEDYTLNVADGGQDLKGLFKVLSHVEETFELDPTEPNHQERIVREYLSATNFGTPDEIQEEIDSWKDRDELQAKAGKFKPKLDAMQAKVVQQKLAQQEQMKKQQAAQAQAYMQNVYNTIAPGELNGLKLDRKTQELLYGGLVQPSYPSISGRPTNLLGHLLEKYQYVEPNHSLIAEALWLLADPDSYRSRIMDQAQKVQVEKTARMLKTEEARRSTGSPIVEKEEVKQRTIKRTNNFFKR